jgi:hypothetical protein
VKPVEQRDGLRERALRLAEEDERIVAGAAVGSLAVDGGDRFSDLARPPSRSGSRSTRTSTVVPETRPPPASCFWRWGHRSGSSPRVGCVLWPWKRAHSSSS